MSHEVKLKTFAVCRGADIVLICEALSAEAAIVLQRSSELDHATQAVRHAEEMLESAKRNLLSLQTHLPDYKAYER